MTTEDPAPRHLYPAQDEPRALRVELSLQGVSARGVAIIAIDDPKFGAEREAPVRIVISLAQAVSCAGCKPCSPRFEPVITTLTITLFRPPVGKATPRKE